MSSCRTSSLAPGETASALSAPEPRRRLGAFRAGAVTGGATSSAARARASRSGDGRNGRRDRRGDEVQPARAHRGTAHHSCGYRQREKLSTHAAFPPSWTTLDRLAGRRREPDEGLRHRGAILLPISSGTVTRMSSRTPEEVSARPGPTPVPAGVLLRMGGADDPPPDTGFRPSSRPFASSQLEAWVWQTSQDVITLALGARGAMEASIVEHAVARRRDPMRQQRQSSASAG